MSDYTHDDFKQLLLAEFPELREEIEDCDGLLHIEMGVFSRHTEEAMDRGDWDTSARCVRIADHLWRSPDAALLNALNVSYLEHLAFDGPHGSTGWSLLTPPLQEGWRAMMECLEQLARAFEELKENA